MKTKTQTTMMKTSITQRGRIALSRLVRLFRRQPPTPIPAPITTHGLAIFWHHHGCPRHIGTEINVQMQSGKTATFRLSRVTPATGVDWSWYEFDFVRYQSLPNS